jgi:hypothetical protein
MNAQLTVNDLQNREIRRPLPGEAIQVHPSQAHHLKSVRLYKTPDQRDAWCIVTPDTTESWMTGFVKRYPLYPTVGLRKQFFYWPICEENRSDWARSWADSAAGAVPYAMKTWCLLKPNFREHSYDLYTLERDDEPNWPEFLSEW